MKRFLSLILCFILLLTLAACGSKNDPEALVDTKPQDDYPYPAINRKFTRESLNALPIKRTDMTTDEMRQLVVDFMYFSKLQALYTPNQSYAYDITPIYPDEFIKGKVYSGMAFMNTGSGNVYRLLDIMDEDTGVLDMTDVMANIDLFSNTGPSACYWAWGRVCSSISYARLRNMTHANGYLRVGPYTYSDTLTAFSETDNTIDICTNNGLVVMSESYAAMKPADAMITSSASTTQMLMVTKDVNVVCFDGSDLIDPNKSTITYVDQNYAWAEQTNDAGDTFLCKSNVDKVYTFMELFNKGYIPFTLAELCGAKPVEETKVETTLPDSDTILTDDLFSSTVTSNFGISDIYITLKNKNGNDVYRHTVRAKFAGIKELNISRLSDNVFIEGDLETLRGDYSIEIAVQLSTGERPVVYSGTIRI